MYFFGLALVVWLIDRLTKYLVANFMYPSQSIPLVEGVFHLTYVQNRGAAFGVLQERTGFFVLVTLLVAGGIIWYYLRYHQGIKSGLFMISLAMILGGALGNLWDRLRYGYVVDVLDFRVWPVFNMADSAIVVGAILLGWYLWREPDNGWQGEKG